MKYIKNIIVFVIVACLLFALGGCGNDNEEKSKFALYKNSFEILNDYFIDYYNQLETEDKSIGFFFEADEFSGLIDHFYGGCEDKAIYPDQDVLVAINNAKKFFIQSFNYISVTSNRISYGGDGSQMIVYSIDGKKPRYFFTEDETDTPSFSTTNLGDDWYYLYLSVR